MRALTRFCAAVVGLEDLADDEDRPVPYSDGLRDRMLDIPYVRLALRSPYRDAILKIREGNRSGPGRPGRQVGLAPIADPSVLPVRVAAIGGDMRRRG